MREIILAAAVALGGTAAHAGTLSLQYFETSSECYSDYFEYEGCAYESFSSPVSFVFDVSLTSPNFYYAEEVEFDEGDIDNPYGATLLAKPEGHLGGYYDRTYQIDLSSTAVSVLGDMFDGDDQLSLRSDYVEEDHNAGQYWYKAFGYWTAAYLPSGPGDGSSFLIDEAPAPVPLPATLPLLALAIGVLGWRRT